MGASVAKRRRRNVPKCPSSTRARGTRRPPTKRRTNGAFVKGESGAPHRRFGQPEGNPVDRGGRPKSLAANIRAKVGDDGEALVRQLLAIANRRGSAWGRVQAIKELLDRGFGKAKQEIDIRDTTPPSQTNNIFHWMTQEEFESINPVLRTAGDRYKRGESPPDGACPAWVVNLRRQELGLIETHKTNGQEADR